MTATIPTLEALLGRGAKLAVCSHLGRPKGKANPEFSLQPVAVRLGELLGRRQIDVRAPAEESDRCYCGDAGSTSRW
mgnify:CR=1 FL=1